MSASMSQAKELRRVIVFISSPGDVVGARESVRKAVDTVNRVLAKHEGFSLEAVGWEDIPSSTKPRPQEAINPYVDGADIFIGILHARFGTPTGLAESGTEEEYLRAAQRWEKEDPKPEILFYFKKPPDELAAAPDSQLGKILAFKERIAKTTFYETITEDDEIRAEVETALAVWIRKNRGREADSTRTGGIDGARDVDLQVLMGVMHKDKAGIADILQETRLDAAAVAGALKRLAERGLVVPEDEERVCPAKSTDGFLAAAKLLLSSTHRKAVLGTTYFALMLKANLKSIIASRFHYDADADLIDLLRKLASLSPATAEYLLFSDTTPYDNLARQVASFSADHQKQAAEITMQMMMHRALLKYAADSAGGGLLHELDGEQVAGQICAVRLVAASRKTKLFEAISTVPSICYKAGCPIKAGQMVSGPPDMNVEIGTIFMNMGESELALRSFDKALAESIPTEARVAGLNNKGLIFLNTGKTTEAESAFAEALKLKPGNEIVARNLELARKSKGPEQEQRRE